ncbi:MAG: hypothetical protein ABI548_13800 [Polyangiaceae bacterium]
MSWIALLVTLADITSASAPLLPSNSAAPVYHTPVEPVEPLEPAEPAEGSPKDEFAAHPVTIESRLGFGLPTGVFGGALSYSPIPALGLDCGAGANLKGLQLACGLRARLVLGSRARSFGVDLSRAFTLTSGLSTGPYEDNHVFERFTAADGPGPASRNYQRAYWWNTDIGVEERYEGLVLRAFGGVALLLNPGAGSDVLTASDQRGEPATTTIGYFGIGMGAAP